MNYCLKTFADTYEKGVKISSEEVRREEFDFATEDRALSYCTNTYDLEEFVRKILRRSNESLADGEDKKYYIVLSQLTSDGEAVLANFEPLGVWESEALKELEEES